MESVSGQAQSIFLPPCWKRAVSLANTQVFPQKSLHSTVASTKAGREENTLCVSSLGLTCTDWKL